MDAKLMVATDPGDVKKLKDVLNKEDAVAMVVVTATSKKPFGEDQSPSARIHPLLLSWACIGSWEGLSTLLKEEEAKIAPTQQFHELVARGPSNAEGMVARDVEEGVDHHPSSLAAGALLKGVTPEGDTALHAVAGNGDDNSFLECATNIYDRNRGLLFQKNHKGNTPLHCAARAGNSKMVSHLIDLAAREGADTKLRLLRMENNCQETALHQAVRFEDGRILVPEEIGARLAAADLAGEERNKDDASGAPEEKNIVKLLMGADPELANYPADGISPLYLAILLRKSTIALTLYDKSGHNLSYSGADGQNALHVAVLRDSVMTELLLRWDKGLIAQVDNDGNTPLHFASSLYFSTGTCLRPKLLLAPPWCHFVRILRRSTWILNILLKAYPAALYQADKDGSFPIHVAACAGAKDMIRVFHAEYPNSIRLCNAKGKTLLHVAVEKGKLDIVLYVCRTSSFAWILNMQDDDGNTALHLAIQARSLRMVCALLGNPEVNFNITNNHGETPRDLSRSMLPHGMVYTLNSENIILRAVWSVGGNHGSLRRDKINEAYNRRVKPEDEDKESERLRNAAQALMVASVLITTVAFTATFALPGGYRADDHANGGTPTLSGSYVFDAFVMATTLAFICSSIATVGFAFVSAPMVNLSTRAVNFNISVYFLLSSVTSLSIAFALGVYMVVSPVARNTAVAVCVITPAVLLSAYAEAIIKLFIFTRLLCIRTGLFPGMVRLLKMYGFTMVISLWPFIVIFGWAALARIHRHR